MAISTVIKKLSIATAGAALITSGAVGISEQAQAETVVAPSSLENTEGNINNGYPFNLDNFSISSQRYQQVYAASEFAFSEPQNITQILFRPDAFEGSAFSSTLANLQINLSTTSKAIDSLSTTFADNIGNDDTVVFSGPLTLSSAFTGTAGGPKDFDIVINLQNPFLYNPSAGNLLLDVRNFAGGSTTQFDAQSQFGDSISRVYTEFGIDGVNASTGRGDSWGLVTNFVTAPPSKAVPEPASVMGLLTLGALGSASVLKRKQQQKA